jgi:catechol 2,3-dioxygenase-like lactoylglutathione lyase family enzyme
MKIHHIALRTRDVARLEAFYAGALGLPVLRREGNVWLAAGDSIVMLEACRTGEPDVPVGSFELVAFAISPRERAKFARRLRIEAETPFTLYVRDPDGRRVGLSHYPDAAETGSAYPAAE